MYVHYIMGFRGSYCRNLLQRALKRANLALKQAAVAYLKSTLLEILECLGAQRATASGRVLGCRESCVVRVQNSTPPPPHLKPQP